MQKSEIVDKMKIHSLAVKSGGLFAMLGMSRILFTPEHTFTTIGNVAVISPALEDCPVVGELDFQSSYNFLQNYGEEELGIKKTKDCYEIGGNKMILNHPFFPEAMLQDGLTSMLELLTKPEWQVSQLTENQLGALKLLSEFSGGSDMCGIEIREGIAYAIFMSRWSTVDINGFGNCSLFSTYLTTIYEFCNGNNIEVGIMPEFIKFENTDTKAVLLIRQANESDMLPMVIGEIEKPRQAKVVLQYTPEIKIALQHAATLCDKRKGRQPVEIEIKNNAITFTYKSNGSVAKEKVVVNNVQALPKTKMDLQALVCMTNEGQSIVEELQICADNIMVSKAPGILIISRFISEAKIVE